MRIVLLNLLLTFVVFTVVLTTVKAKRIKAWQNSYGELSSQGRVVGGSTAADGEAPYQISLQDFYGHYCGGAIIDEQWIITAAHCVASRPLEDIIVMTGSQDLTVPGVFYHVQEKYIHCNYNNPDMHNDIALLHLNSSIVMNTYTKVVALPTHPMTDGDEIMLTGWGSEEAWGESPDRLKKVTLKYMIHQRCREAYDDDPDVDVGHICTFTKVGEGSCHGDSGGPLVSKGHLVGVVNWGYPCAVGYPDVHASPLYYSDWIRTIMSGNAKC